MIKLEKYIVKYVRLEYTNIHGEGYIMSCRLPPWNQESLKNNISYMTTYDQYSNYTWVTLVAHIPWIPHYYSGPETRSNGPNFSSSQEGGPDPATSLLVAA